MVQSDRQGPIRDDAEGGLRGSGGQPRRGRGGSCLGRTFREGQGRKSAAPERGVAAGGPPGPKKPTGPQPPTRGEGGGAAGGNTRTPTGGTNRAGAGGWS